MEPDLNQPTREQQLLEHINAEIERITKLGVAANEEIEASVGAEIDAINEARKQAPQDKWLSFDREMRLAANAGIERMARSTKQTAALVALLKDARNRLSDPNFDISKLYAAFPHKPDYDSSGN